MKLNPRFSMSLAIGALILGSSVATSHAMVAGTNTTYSIPRAGVLSMYAFNANGGLYICSGVLDPKDTNYQTLITATHCLTGVTSQNIFKVYLSNSQSGYGAYPAGANSTPIFQYSATIGAAGSQEQDLGNDVSVLHLSCLKQHCPTYSLSYQLSSAPLSYSNNSIFDVEGFGYNQRGVVTTSQWVSLLSSNSFQPTLASATLGLIKVSSASITESQNTNLGYGAACIGDSGGPSFFATPSVTYLVGITSTGDSACQMTNVISRLDTIYASL